jgi:hypothetical protein
MAEQYVEMHDFNGLGEKVNKLDKQEASCRAEMLEKHRNNEKDIGDHDKRIETLFKSLEGIKTTVNRAMGGIAVLVAGLSLLGIIIEHFWK